MLNSPTAWKYLLKQLYKKHLNHCHYVGFQNKHSLFYKTYFIVTQRDNNREKFMIQRWSAVNVRIKRILFDTYCIIQNTLIIITIIYITGRA